MNNELILGKFVNTKIQNIIGFIILAITIFLGFKSIFKVFNLL